MTSKAPEPTEFHQYCYELFEANPKGKEFLEALERQFFYAPVIIPGKEQAEHWGFFNEGRNDLIRAFRHGVNVVKAKPKDNS